MTVSGRGAVSSVFREYDLSGGAVAMGDMQFEFEFTLGSGSAEVREPGSGWAFGFGDASDRAGCSRGACPHPAAHPAEQEWVRLASAVPVPGQLHRFKPHCEGMAYPTEEDFRAAVSAVRPEEPDEYSIQRIRTAWSQDVAERLSQWPERLRSGLSDLADGWAGEDFEAFAAQVDSARALLDGLLDDVADTAAEMLNREEAIYTLQGGDSGEIPYPAPMVGTEGEWSNMVALHVRPAWWQGDCMLMGCEDAERALKMAGADAGLATQVREFIEERVNDGFSASGGVVSQLRPLVGEEARERFGPLVEAELAAYTERQAAIDESIAHKRAGHSAELEAFAPSGQDRPCPTAADHTFMDLRVPRTESPGAPDSPLTRQDPSLTPPGGGAPAPESDEDASEPGPEAEDLEEAGGAWARGGEWAPGGLAEGSAGSGGPITSGGGGGGPAPSSGAWGGTAATAAPGPMGSAGTGGPRAGGAFGGPHPSAAPKGGPGADDDDASDGRDGDLTNREIENVWGYVNPKNDPYA